MGNGVEDFVVVGGAVGRVGVGVGCWEVASCVALSPSAGRASDVGLWCRVLVGPISNAHQRLHCQQVFG